MLGAPAFRYRFTRGFYVKSLPRHKAVHIVLRTCIRSRKRFNVIAPRAPLAERLG